MRSSQYEQGRRNGIKACVAFLHAAADEMNDPSARAALNSTAHQMGVMFKLSPPSPLTNVAGDQPGHAAQVEGQVPGRDHQAQEGER